MEEELNPPLDLSPLPEEITLSDEATPEVPVNLNDPTLPRPPSTVLAENRAQKVHYALGEQSPGSDPIKNQLVAGQEPMIRKQIAANEDYVAAGIKTDMVRALAQSQGGAVSPELADLVYGLTTEELKNDPATVLEKKFADKYINDISSVIPFETWNNNPAVEKNDAVGRDQATFHQFALNQFQDLQNELDQSSFLYQGWTFAVGMLPILPWYRQAQALQDKPSHLENWGMGETMLDNVQNIMSRPLEDRVATTQKAIKYLKENGNLRDAMTLAQSLVSFSTADRYIANTVSIADYSTLAAPFLRWTGLLRAGKAGELIRPTSEVQAAKEAGSALPQIEFQGSNKFTTQGELAGFERPVQGELFEGNQGLGTKPIELRKGSQRVYRGPDGQMRSLRTPEPTPVSPTGIFRDKSGRFSFDTGAMRQLELDLPPGVGRQLEMDLLPPPLRGKPPKDLNDIEGTPRPPSGPAPTEDVRQHARVIADGLKALEGRMIPDPVEVAASVGDTMAAAAGQALRRFTDANPTGMGSVAKQIKDFLDPEFWLRGGRTVPAGTVEDMAKTMKSEADMLTHALAGGLLRVNRLTLEALAIGIEKAKLALQHDFGRLGRAIQRTQYLPAEMHPANVDTLSYIIHKPDGALFESKAQALIYRDEHYKLGESAIPREQGKGWYLEIPQHINENDPDVLEAMKTLQNRSNKGMSSILGRFVRTSKDLLSPLQNQNREIASHVPQELTAAIKKIAQEDIAKLPKNSRNAVSDMLVINRDNPSPLSPKAPRGFWYENAGEFEAAFMDKHRRPPTTAETKAYLTYKRLHDFELLMENSAVYRDKARLGVKQFSLKMEKDGQIVDTPFFEGIKLQKMPWELGAKLGQDAGIWIEEAGKSRFYYLTDPALEKKYIDDLIENRGYSVVQVFEPTKHPLEGLATTLAKNDLREQVNYIITNTLQDKPLSWQQVNYRAGPHSGYVHNWYVAQPVIKKGRNGKSTFYGDNNALNVETQAQAEKWAGLLDHGRLLLKNGETAALKTFLAEKTPYSYDQFLDLFRRADSPFSTDHPIVYKQRGKTTFDTYHELKSEGYANIVDARKNVHDPSNLMDKSFLMDRDEVISTINERTWQVNPAMQIDPYTMLNQVMGQRIRNVWTNDYKISAILSWVKDFEHVLKPTEQALLAHPMYFLFHPEYINAAATQMGDLAAAKAARQAIINFIGHKTDTAKYVDAFKMKLLNSVYSVTGQGKLLDLAIATTADPVNWLRAVAFHSKLGLFNPVQLFLQANQMAHSIAVSGVEHGMAGMSAAFLMRRLGHNPNALDKTAQIASRFGWKADEFKEMYQAFQRTGIYQVAGEAALRDDVFDPHLFRGLTGRFFLDSGSMFFNEGERMGRLTSFATAYKDYRKANPTGKIGNRELAKIVDRSDDLAGNMTVASKAAYQSGVWSIPTQFVTWAARMQEQLLTGALHDITGGAIGRAGRLTGAEKVRMLTTYSLLYGVPIGMGTGVGLWPVYDSMKKEAQLRGINLNDGFFEPLTQGLIETGLHYLTGRQYNIPQRFGTGNSTMLRDAIFGDKNLAESFFGASGTIVGDIIRTTAPFQYWVSSIFTDREAPVTATDWMTVARNINSFDLADKITGILAYQKWLTKTGTVVDDKVDGIDAMAAALGLSPMRVADTFLARTALKEERNEKAAFQQSAVESLRKAMTAASQGDWATWTALRKQAAMYIQAGDLNYDQQKAVYDRALNELGTLKDKVNWDLARTAGPSRIGR